MACALGLGDALVGITHECDFPAELNGKPIVVRAVLPIEQMSQDEIDAAVSQRISAGLSLYQVDEELLRQLDPDLILTQDLCQVCAPSGNEVAQVLQLLPRKPRPRGNCHNNSQGDRDRRRQQTKLAEVVNYEGLQIDEHERHAEHHGHDQP